MISTSNKNESHFADQVSLNQNNSPDVNWESNNYTYTPTEELIDYIILLKPRVMSLVVFTALCGLLMAPGNIHPLLGIISILCITIGAGASGCLNMWYDRDIDLLMSRTKNRPIPQKRIKPANALAFGLILSIGSVIIMGTAINWLSASLLAFTIFFYAVIYSMWLKRSTPQNIVIGGAAGALPPVIGWAAVSNSTPMEAWILFAIIFLWTPPHFWALALYKNDDYVVAKIPMLPVVSGPLATKRQIVLYTLLLISATMTPVYLGTASIYYGAISGFLNILFLYLSLKVYYSNTPKQSMTLFWYSILYLFLIFTGLTIDKLTERFFI